MLQIWTNKDANYIEEKDAELCRECGDLIEYGNLIIDASQDKRKGFVSFYCLNCVDKIKTFGDQIQQIPFYVVKKLPKDVEPFFIKPVALVSGSMLSTFEVGEIEKLGGITEDNTKYSNRSPKVLDLLEEKRQELKLLDEEKAKPLNNEIEFKEFIKNLGEVEK